MRLETMPPRKCEESTFCSSRRHVNWPGMFPQIMSKVYCGVSAALPLSRLSRSQMKQLIGEIHEVIFQNCHLRCELKKGTKLSVFAERRRKI